MLKVNLTEAETCLAKLVEEAANGEEVIITHEDGSAFQLTCVTGVPSALNANEGELYNPEGIWDKSVTSQDIGDARKEMWQKFDAEDSD